MRNAQTVRRKIDQLTRYRDGMKIDWNNQSNFDIKEWYRLQGMISGMQWTLGQVVLSRTGTVIGTSKVIEREATV